MRISRILERWEWCALRFPALPRFSAVVKQSRWKVAKMPRAMTTITVIQLPDDLRGALAAAGMSQNDLAATTNIDAGTISRYVNGLAPTPRNAAKIAEALGLVIDGPVPV